MHHLIIKVSGYLLILLILFYTVFTLSYFRMRTHEGRTWISSCQRFFLFSLDTLGFLVLYLQTENMQILILYGFQLVFLIAYMVLWKNLYPKASRMILNNMLLLLSIGFIVQTRLDLDKSMRQFLIVLGSGVVSLFVPVVIARMKKLQKGAILYGLAGIALLGVVLVAGGTEYGAKLSIGIGGFSLQPSEFVKLIFVFFVAAMLKEGSSFLRIAVTTVLAGAHVILLVLSRDLGTALIFFFTYIWMLYLATHKLRYSLAGVVAGAVAAVGAYHLFTHVQTRVSVWQNPWADPTGDGWQILQSLFAVGTGGWLGLGLGEGLATTIPVVTKDFVFSAIAEELGGIFALCLVFVSVECIMQFLWIAGRIRDRFSKLVVCGLAVLYGCQIFINVAGVTKMIPSTGLTYPLVSYGGSSMLATFLMFSIIQGYHVRMEDEEEEFEEQRRKKARGAGILRNRLHRIREMERRSR